MAGTTRLTRLTRLTMAQALIRFLSAQHVERDGVEDLFFSGVLGIFGHGNVAGVGQALYQYRDLMPYHLARNEQAMVHIAAGHARMRDRLGTFACTSSIGPGATNMVTGAALATIDRLPVLLLPGDVFASRRPDPMLQQLEVPSRGDVTVNDAFIPVSRYFDRIMRPEQIVPAALAAMRVLTSQADTGAVTLALPQDVQVEAFDVPDEFLAKRVWHIGRPIPDAGALARLVELIGAARRPLIVAGGGLIYSRATEALQRFVERSGIPVAETQAGKGALPWDHPSALGAIGVTGTSAANRIAEEADLVIGIGTRWSDFTTGSRALFARPDVRFANVNIAEFDGPKMGALAVTGDARATLEVLALVDQRVDDGYRATVAKLKSEWDTAVDAIYARRHAPLPAQSEVIGVVNEVTGPRDVVIGAAGSLPGELHKLWRARDPKQYHVEYGYSCMGYEIPAGIGVKLAAPDRDVFVMVGDGSYLMMPSEIVTAIQEHTKLVIVLVDNQGFSSIGALSRSLGQDGFGTQYRYRKNGSLGFDSDKEPLTPLPVDLAANAESLGARVLRTKTIEEFRAALVTAKQAMETTVVYIRVDRYEGVTEGGAWWDVATPEVAEAPAVREAHERATDEKRRQRWHL
ncbi:MAG: 3D-(3,5/4)-trihydroxycyclohexane-1,2-dione acylhydrolase (decyclizing) [Candidatus Limnocylindria bacterium]|nr:3D-(3,5/4)-trihydroxycyclohexane-1,2-dione acylhydrolase (decyclizing) [Candidatus Limnocylindria bacterium]